MSVWLRAAGFQFLVSGSGLQSKGVVCEAGSYVRLMDSCITQLNARGLCGTCNESKEEKEVCGQGGCTRASFALHFRISGSGFRASGFEFRVPGFSVRASGAVKGTAPGPRSRRGPRECAPASGSMHQGFRVL